MELCDMCDSNPPLAPGMSLCRACLKAKVEAGRREREERWARQRQKAEALKDWQRPLDAEEPKP